MPSPKLDFVSKFGLKNMQIADVDHGQLQVVQDDPYLKDHENDIKLRHKEFHK